MEKLFHVFALSLPSVFIGAPACSVLSLAMSGEAVIGVLGVSISLSEWCWELHGPSVGFTSACDCFPCRGARVWDRSSGGIFELLR